MSQDTVADALNQIMNMKKVGKKEVVISKYSKVLINLLEIMKENGHIDFEVNDKDKKLIIKILRINECRAIKPRYYVTVPEIEKYLRRFLPSRKIGNLIVSTNKGLLNHKECFENKIGGALIAYFY